MLQARDACFFVQGAMSMREAKALMQAGVERCAGADCVFDLAEVSSVDSAALAVVLAWVRAAQAAGHSLSLRNPPAAFLSLSSLYDLDEMLAAHLAPGSAQ